MAIAGSATLAYYVEMCGGVLVVNKTTAAMSLCMSLDAAERAVKDGQRALVAGGDAYALRLRLTGQVNG